MKLLIVRHAIAVDRSEWSKPDAERPLTDKGRAKMKENARGMKRLRIEPDVILTSPYRRAYDTAQIIAKTFNKTDALILSKHLQPDGNPLKLIQQVAVTYKNSDSVMLVGHEPYLSKLLSLLIGGENLSIELKKGALAILSAENLHESPRAHLDGFLPPKVLRAVQA